nr:hypothetical protein [Corynebacterium frankenforstense]
MEAQTPRRRLIRDDFSRGEAVGGIFWLCLGALVSVLLEVVYLDAWVTLPGGASLAVPWTVVVAFLFNLVLSRTALLWTPRTWAAGMPLWVWIGGFVLLTFWVTVTGDQLVGANVRSLVLLGAGVAGGGWPLVAGK